MRKSGKREEEDVKHYSAFTLIFKGKAAIIKKILKPEGVRAMAVFDEKGLRKNIREKAFFPVYLFFGDESYLKTHYVNLLAQTAVDKGFESLNLDRFDGKNTDLRTIFDRALTLPMLSEKRVVIVEDYKLESLTEKDAKALSASFEELQGGNSVLVFLQSGDTFGKKNGKKAIALFEKFGAVCELNRRKGSELIKPLISSAAKQGVVLSPAMAQYLVSCVGDDFNVLINELTKVCNYAGSGEVTKKHIDAVAVKTVDAKVSSLTRSLISGNFEKAYDILDSLITLKTEPNYILGSIIGTYVDMYRAKVACQCTGTAQPLAPLFNYKGREFALNYAARDASKIELSALRACLDELNAADAKLKSTGTAQTLIIEQLMVKLLLIANGEKK